VEGGVSLRKKKKEPEEKTIRDNETQKLTGKRNLPKGFDKRGGQSPK